MQIADSGGKQQENVHEKDVGNIEQWKWALIRASENISLEI